MLQKAQEAHFLNCTVKDLPDSTMHATPHVLVPSYMTQLRIFNNKYANIP
jgi:hypothetical protein